MRITPIKLSDNTAQIYDLNVPRAENYAQVIVVNCFDGCLSAKHGLVFTS